MDWTPELMDWTPELSRRARAVPVWTALRSLGREGIAALVDRCCDHAERLAAGLRRMRGVEVMTRSMRARNNSMTCRRGAGLIGSTGELTGSEAKCH
jgi:glutamate/tyrosine decarboxylase-like PLP-dependent enzyme